MSILTLDEARLIDPSIGQARLDAFEAMVRTRTRNLFHFGTGVRGVTVAPSGDDLVVTGPLHDDSPAFREGDTANVTRCGISDGLYTVVSATEDARTMTVTLTGAPYRRGGHFNDGALDLVVYPADVIDGVSRMIQYDVDTRSRDRNVKSKTVGRTTEQYVDTPVGSYPAELLAFLTPHNRLSFGGTSRSGLPDIPPNYRPVGHVMPDGRYFDGALGWYPE